MINEKIGGGAETLDLSGYLNGGWTVDTGGWFKAYKAGRTVMITGYNLYNNSPSQAVVTTLPDRLGAIYNCLAAAACVEDNAYTYSVIADSGSIFIVAPVFVGWYTPGKHYRFSITYISKA